MQQDLQTNIKLDAIETQLKTINKNLLNVFWIVGFFALLYFGLMIYLVFYRWFIVNVFIFLALHFKLL